jgi:hypothetical protein
MNNQNDLRNPAISDTELADMLYAAFSRNEVDEAYVPLPGQKCAPLQNHEVVRDIFAKKQEALAVYRTIRGIK